MNMETSGKAFEDCDTASQREAPRESMFLKARMSTATWAEPIDVIVRNVSAGGAMAVTERHLPIGVAVTLEFRRLGAVGGKVVRADRGKIGIAFDHVIDPQQLRLQPTKSKPDDRPYVLRRYTLKGRDPLGL